MASLRDLSPSEDEMESPQITSKSNLQAMLDSISDNSDNESNYDSESQHRSPTKNKISLSSRGISPITKQSIQQSDNEEDEVEEEIFNPRGRLAARMQAVDANDEKNETQETLNARERVKMLLARSKKSPTPPMAQDNISGHDNMDDDEEEDVTVSKRVRNRRPMRSATPEALHEDVQSSPGGMFVSPGSNRAGTPTQDASDSDADLPANLTKNARVLAIVARKRKEREAQQAEARRLKEQELAERARFQKSLSDDEAQEGSDTEAGQRLTQQARPTRKASKKALEEMHRETQRMSRNMQLAHEARTKKKVTKASLFAKFNYKPANMPEDESAPSSSPRRVDEVLHDTPPTSPIALPKISEKDAEPIETLQNENDNDLPTLAEALSEHTARFSIHSSPKVAGGKKIDLIPSSPPTESNSRAAKDRTQLPIADESDSDLEILNPGNTKAPSRKGRLDYVFDRVPTQKSKESQSLHALRMLAHLNSPPQKTGRGRNAKPSLTIPELQLSLQQQARRQATREREERLQSLKDRGVYIPTAEEREKELAEVENLMARARREGEEIMRREREASKKDRKENGTEEIFADESDDGDWEENDQLSENMSNNESDDGDENEEEEEETEEEDNENDDDDMAIDELDDVAPGLLGALIDDQASESGEEEDIDMHMGDDDEDIADLPQTRMRRSRKSNVISDDEDEETRSLNAKSPMTAKTNSPVAPQSVLRSATKTFIPGLPVAGAAGLGLTQIFAGTMDDSQEFDNDAELPQFTPHKDTSNNSMAFLRRLPPPTMASFNPVDEDSQEVIKDSQVPASQVPASQADEAETQGIQLDFSQTEVHGYDSLMQDPSGTQISDIAMTQDVGFQEMSPIKGRFSEAPPSTVDTVLIDANSTARERISESPIVKRKGRLQRRLQTTVFSDDEEDAPTEQADDNFEISANAFDVMRRAIKKKAHVEEFDKKKSEAKNMVHEQAEESEDEYAGLGGASDDESGGEEDALVKEMIDDEAGKDADERQIAAFFAEKDRQNDEKQVEKLFNDITKGMLRRKRGADYDLSDSDDDGEARRRMKRKEFAKMRKSLLEDERIGKIAENPKREAFLRAIEDRDVGEEIDFLDNFDDSDVLNAGISQSQDDSQPAVVADSQPDTSMGPPKRKRSEMSDIENRPPPHMRRTKGVKRPSNISEIRESLSSLIDEPNTIQADVELSDDSDLEIVGDGEEDIYNDERVKSNTDRDPFALRRPQAAVIDRISLKRASSGNLSANTKLAFSTASNPNFKVPALLRRTTTNTSSSSSVSAMSATERMAGAFGEEKIKRGGSKTSGINYFARENERREKVREGEKRREEKRFKGAEGRRKAVGGLFGKGKFE